MAHVPKFALAMLILTISTRVSAGLVYTGFFENEAHSGTTRLDLLSPSIAASVSNGEAILETRNIVSHAVNAGGTFGVVDPRTFFSIRTEDKPVLLSNIRTSFVGRATLSGGGPGTNYEVSFNGGTSILRHDDTNGNGILEGGEGLFDVAGPWEAQLESLSDHGSTSYDMVIDAGSETVLLDPFTSYVVLQDFFFSYAGTSAVTDPFSAITVDYESAPSERHETRFDFQAVPEPSSCILVFSTLLVLVRCRRKRSEN